MAMTAEQLRERQHFLGSSDVPAILGLDRYRTPRDVFLEKTNRVEPDVGTNDPAEFGSDVEPVLVAWAGKKLGVTVTRGQVAHHPEHPFMRAQLDGWVESQQATIEAKAIGVWNPRFDGSEWGNDGSDHVPFNVMAQVAFAMACSAATAAYVVALLGQGMGVRVYYLPRNEALVKRIEQKCEEFWWGNVVADKAPDAPVSIDVAQRIIREPGKSAEVSHDWPDRWLSLRDQEALVKNAVQEARRDILVEMQDAEVGFTPFGEFSYRPDSRGRKTFRYKGAPNE